MAVVKTFTDFTGKGVWRSFKQRLEEGKYVILVFSLDLVHVASKAIHADYKQEQIFWGWFIFKKIKLSSWIYINFYVDFEK